MNKVYSKQFPSEDEAIAYCESKGKLKFFGRIGEHFEYATYNLYIGNTVYHIDIRKDGYLRVTHERYKRNDE